MLRILAVGAGGALGSMLRFGVGIGAQRLLGSAFPYGTLLVNVLGCFVIGLTYVWFIEKSPRPELHVLMTVGVLGGFTTFSAFSLETVMLLSQASYGRAALNVGASLVLCFAGTMLGILLARQM